MGICAHSSLPFRGQLGQVRDQLSAAIEQFLRAVALHPLFQKPQVIGFAGEFGKRHLMRAPGVLNRLSVHHARTCPAFGRAKNDHRPRGATRDSLQPGLVLDGAYFRDHGIERPGHELVHNVRFAPFYEIGIVPISCEELRKLAVGHSTQHRGVGDFVAVQVQDGQNGAVARRVQEFVRVPAGRERSRLRFPVAHDATDQQFRVIKRGAVGMSDGVSRCSLAFMDRSWCSSASWLGMPPGKENCLKRRCIPSTDCWMLG